jgi:nucleoside phosphorylase
MEASAFLHVCQHTGVISLGVVKGVSDLGDKNKVVNNDSDNDYNAALVNTANAVKHWIGHTPDTITPSPRGISPQTF